MRAHPCLGTIAIGLACRIQKRQLHPRGIGQIGLSFRAQDLRSISGEDGARVEFKASADGDRELIKELQLVAQRRCGGTDGACRAIPPSELNGVLMPTRYAHACFGVWMVALTAAFYLVPQLSMFTWAAIGLSGAAAVLLGIRLHRPSRRLPWVLLSGVLVSFTAGDTVYNILTDYLGKENPFPSLADGFYLAVYPMLAAALLILIRARSGANNRAALLDALLPTAGLGLLSWVFLIAPYVRDTELTLAEKLTSVAYPLGDVLALAMLLRLFTAPGRKPMSITILGAGVTGLLVTDVLYGLRQLAGTWEVGGPTDAGWVFFYAAIGISALHPSMTRLTPVMELSPVVAEAGGKRIVLMSVASLIAPAVLLLQDLRGEVNDAPVIAAACAVMFLLVMARVSGLLSTQRQAGARERALRRAGAMLVAAASEDDAADALRGAVAELMPEGQPYRLHLAWDDETANEVSGVDYHANLVRVDSLPPAIAAQLAGFDFALRTSVVGDRAEYGGSGPPEAGLSRRDARDAGPAPAELRRAHGAGGDGDRTDHPDRRGEPA